MTTTLAGTIGTRPILAGDISTDALEGGQALPSASQADLDALEDEVDRLTRAHVPLDGEDGQDGEPGAPGQPGRAGAAGPMAAACEDGQDGEQGFPGVPGPVGARGAPGNPAWSEDGDDEQPAGPPGPRGPQGIAGAPGASLVLDAEDDVEPSPRPGPQGPSGPVGPPGAPAVLDVEDDGGPDVRTGPQGPQGPPGPARGWWHEDVDEDADPWCPPLQGVGAANRDPALGWVTLYEQTTQTENAASSTVYGTACTFVPLPNTRYELEYWIEHSSPASTTGFRHGIFQTAVNQSETIRLEVPASGTTQVIELANGFNFSIPATTSMGSNIHGFARGVGTFVSHLTAPSAITLHFHTEVAASTVTVYSAELRYRIVKAS